MIACYSLNSLQYENQNTKTMNKLLKEWFKRRFNRNPEDDQAYFHEWVHRLNVKGMDAFIAYMDSKSRKVWADLMQEQVETED